MVDTRFTRYLVKIGIHTCYRVSYLVWDLQGYRIQGYREVLWIQGYREGLWIQGYREKDIGNNDTEKDCGYKDTEKDYGYRDTERRILNTRIQRRIGDRRIQRRIKNIRIQKRIMNIRIQRSKVDEIGYRDSEWRDTKEEYWIPWNGKRKVYTRIQWRVLGRIKDT